MVIDTGQIKTERRREGKERKKKIQEYFRIATEMVKLCFLTFMPAILPLSQIRLDIAQRI